MRQGDGDDVSSPSLAAQRGGAVASSGPCDDVAPDSRQSFDLPNRKPLSPQHAEGAIPLLLVERCQPIREICPETRNGDSLRFGFAEIRPSFFQAHQAIAPVGRGAELFERYASSKKPEHNRRVADSRLANVFPIAAPWVISWVLHSGIQRVEMDVAHCGNKMALRFDGNAVETILEYRTDVAVSPVEVVGVLRCQSMASSGQVRGGGPCQEVYMIVHKTPGEQTDIVFLRKRTKLLDEPQTILIVFEQPASARSPHCDVIYLAIRFLARLSRHGRSYLPATLSDAVIIARYGKAVHVIRK